MGWVHPAPASHLLAHSHRSSHVVNDRYFTFSTGWVHPAPQPMPNVPTQESRPADIVVDDSRSKFTIEPLRGVPRIDSSITLFAVLCGKKHDVAFNARVIRFVQRYHIVVHLSLCVYGLAVLSLLCVSDHHIQVPLLIVAIVSGLIASLLGACVLSWDVVCLVVTSFEFWYLTFVCWTFIMTGLVIFPDVARQLGFMIAGVACQVTFFIDASTYMRRYAIRTFMLGAPGLVFGSLVTKLGLLPNLRNVSIIGGGINVNAVDLAVNNAMTTALFMGVKALPSFRLAAPGDTVKEVVCELYYPVCHLVPVSTIPPQISNSRHPTDQRSVAPFLLDNYNVIDTRKTIASQGTVQLMRILTGSRIFPILGWVGLVASFSSSVWHIAMASTSSQQTSEQHTLATIGLATTIGYVFVCMLHYQCTLLHLLVLHFDMWFVSIQWTMMTLSACDRLSWDARTLLLWSSWLWCHWTLGLDALPPSTRQRMGYHVWFAKAVTAVLAVYPILLVYWIYYSGTPNITDNQLFYFKVYSYEVGMTMSSFLSSKIPTVWMWMVRFLWCHPPHAFKFIRRRLEYPVITTTVPDEQVKVSEQQSSIVSHKRVCCRRVRPSTSVVALQ